MTDIEKAKADAKKAVADIGNKLAHAKADVNADVEKIKANIDHDNLGKKVAYAKADVKADAAKAVDGVFDAITDALKTGDEVRLIGFGTFVVSDRAASEGRNPRTGEKITIPASKQPKFKPGKGLKDAIN